MIEDQLKQIMIKIQELPIDWHSAGSLSPSVLASFINNASRLPLENSIETGTGKSTLLLSHMSKSHTVFTIPNESSYRVVSESEFLNRSTTEFVLGPTQQTLVKYPFDNPIDFALIDGPHAYPFPELEYFRVYPYLKTGALLIIDDIHIPTIFNLFSFLCEDEMFNLIEVVETTAFFRRNGSGLFSPVGDGWTRQAYNKNRFPIVYRQIREMSELRGVDPLIPSVVEFEQHYKTIINSPAFRAWCKIRRVFPRSIRKFLGSRT